MNVERFNHSGPKQPCPICNRTKDRDCSWNDNLVLCHTYAKEPPPQSLAGWKFTGKYADSGIHGPGTAAVFAREEEKKAVRPAKEAKYKYLDERGNHILRVCRKDDGKGKRSFWQEYWDGDRWVKGLPNELHPKIHLYRWMESINFVARKNGHPLLIVEGEGKADLLISMGIAATCPLGGAGKWKKYGYPNYLKDLEGATLVICPDRDQVGLVHAEAIAQDFPNAKWLYPFPDSPLWERLPKSGGLDIADWINDCQLTPEQVLQAIGPKRDFTPAQADADPPQMELEPDDEIPKLLIDYRKIERKFGDRLRYNSLFKSVELDGEEFEPVTAKLEFVVQHWMNLKSSREDVGDIVLRLAKQNSYSPVTEYLNQVHEQHGNCDALDLLAYRYFGATEPIHQTLLQKFLIGSVARAFQPGCKLDCALILQGKQGAGKSTFFKILASEPWFDDSLGPVSDKDERLKLHRSWFIEWAELETIFSRKDINQVKAFMSCSIDQVRPPYGRAIEAMKRSSVIVGSTNQQEFLADATGNRRFWVIPVSKQIDREQLQQERDKIWATAVSLYRAGEPWWLTGGEELQTEETREQFKVSDTWADLIAEYVDVKEVVSIAEILETVFDLEAAKHEKVLQNRVRNILTGLGWKPLNSARVHLGKRQKVWLKTSEGFS